MKKRILLSVLFISLLFAYLTSCSQNFFADKSDASISISLPGGSSGRAAVDKSSLFYKLKCETESGNVISEQSASSGENVTFDELEPGSYVISADAYLNETVQMLLYSGSVSVRVSSGEDKNVTITLKYVGPKTELPFDLYNFQDRNNCARIILEDSYFYVDTENPYNLEPSYFYWFGKEGFIEELSGETNDIYSTSVYSSYISEPNVDYFGVIVKFKDDSYSIRSFITDILLDGNCNISSSYKENTGSSFGKGKFIYSCKYPNVSNSNKLEFFITPLENFFEKGNTVTSTELKTTSKDNSTFTSATKMEVATTKQTYEADLEPGWYMANAKISIYNDGYTSSSVPDVYELRTAVYVEDNYTLNYSCDFPFDDYYSDYWYKFEWNLNGASWPSGATVSEYCIGGIDTTIEMSIPKPTAALGEIVDFVFEPDIGEFVYDYDDATDTYIFLLPEPSPHKKNVKVNVIWEADAADFESLQAAVNAQNISRINLTGDLYAFTDTITIRQNKNIIIPTTGLMFMRDVGFSQEMFVIESDGINDVTLDFQGTESYVLTFEGDEEVTYNKSVFAISDSKTTLNLDYCKFTKFKCKNNGPVINCVNGNINITHSQFTTCSLVDKSGEGNGGGAIYVKDGQLTIGDNCMFQANTASERGGAIYIEGTSSKLTINCSSDDNSTMIKKNTASQYGGSVFIQDATVNIINTYFVENTAGADYGRGGAIYVTGSGLLDIQNANFSRNETGVYGGAIHCEYADLKIRATEFIDNKATDTTSGAGGALWIGVGNRTDLSGLTLRGNIANGSSNNISLFYAEEKKDNLSDYLTLDADLEAVKQPGVGNSYIF